MFNSARISPIDGELTRKFVVVDSLTAGDDGGAEEVASGTDLYIDSQGVTAVSRVLVWEKSKCW